MHPVGLVVLTIFFFVTATLYRSLIGICLISKPLLRGCRINQPTVCFY